MESEIINHLIKLSKLKKFQENAKLCNFNDLQFEQHPIISKNKLVEHLNKKIQFDVVQQYGKSNYELELTDNAIVSSTSILVSLIKSGKLKEPERLLELTQRSLQSHHADRLASILIVKTILKHSDPSKTLLSFIIDFLENHINPIESIFNASKYLDFYFLNKYFKCIKLCLNRQASNSVTFIDNTLNQIIDFHANFQCIETGLNDLIKKNALANTLELTVYLSIYSNRNLSLDGLDKFKKILISEDKQFKPDIIYSGIYDDNQQIEFNLICLERRLQSINKKELSNASEFLFDFYLEPSLQFWKLSSSIAFDSELVIEWLITSETKFLIYFLKFLKYLYADLVKNKLSNLERIFYRTNDLTNQARLFSFLKKIYSKLSSLKRSFPYNCTPLLKLLINILNEINI